MGVGWSFKPKCYMHATTLLLAAFFCCTVLSFEPDPAYYSTPHEAIEYAAWKALKEGKPPCVTVHHIGITLFCIMGQCVQDRNGSSYCQCRQHFAGLTCSIYKGKCTSETLCSPHLCKDNPSKISLYECVCKPGYHVPDSPAFSHCIPDNLLGSATRERESKGPISAIILPSTKNSAEKNSHLNFSVSDMTTSMTSGFHRENKASQLSVMCKTSDFRTSFIEPEEEKKTEGLLFRQTSPRTDSNVLALHDIENRQDPPPDEVKERNKAKVGTKAGSAISYMGLSNALTSQFIGLEMPTLASQHYSKRAVNMQLPTIRRRRASTFQTDQDEAPEIQLTLDDMKGYSAHIKKQEISSKKKHENLISIFNSEHNMPVLSHAIDKGTNHEHITSSTEAAPQPPRKESLKEGDEDYEVSQFRKKLLHMAPVQLARSEGYIYNSMQGHAAYLVAAEMERELGGKQHVKHKQLPAEAQDAIIDSLKHAVEASENNKTNETNGDSETRKGNILVVADKRMRRKSGVVQGDYVAENNTTNQRLSFLPVSSPLAFKNKKDTSMPTEQHRVIRALMQHYSEESHLQEATHTHDENQGRKMRRLRYGVVPVMTWRKHLQPHKGGKIALRTSHGLNIKTKELRRYKSSHDPNREPERMNQIPWSEVLSQALCSSKYHVSTNCNHSSVITSHVNYQTFNKTKQYLSKQGARTAFENSTNYSPIQHVSPALDISGSEARESSSDVYAKHKTQQRHSFGKDPMLFFNVTVLSDGGRNKSALYLVPFAGSKAILISWSTYNDSL